MDVPFSRIYSYNLTDDAGTITVAATSIFTANASLTNANVPSSAGRLLVTGQLSLQPGSTNVSPTNGVGLIKCGGLVMPVGVSLNMNNNDMIVDYGPAAPRPSLCCETWSSAPATSAITASSTPDRRRTT